MKYKLVIFDVDGTLLDTSEGLISSARYTIKQLGYGDPTKDILLSFVGPRIQDALYNVYGICGEALDEAAEVFRNHYKKKDVFKAKTYYGIHNIVEQIYKSGRHIAVATNKRQDFVDALMEKHGLTEYIKDIYGTDFEGRLKKADLINKCIYKFPQYELQEILMVGDSLYDAAAAYETGIDFLGVSYGFEFKSAKDAAPYKCIGMAETPIQILSFL